MKAKVIMPFKDKEIDKVRNTNEVFDTTKERYAEINKSGRFVVEVKDEVKSANKAEKK